MKTKIFRVLQTLTGPALGLTATVCVSLGVVLGELGSPWAGLPLSLIGVGFGGLAGHLVGEESERRRHTRTPGPIPNPDEDAWFNEWLTDDRRN
jgi:hypothetical protein